MLLPSLSTCTPNLSIKRHVQVRERRALVLQVDATFQVRLTPSGDENRDVLGQVDVAVAQARSVEDDRVIEQRAIAVRRLRQPIEEIGEAATPGRC